MFAAEAMCAAKQTCDGELTVTLTNGDDPTVALPEAVGAARGDIGPTVTLPEAEGDAIGDMIPTVTLLGTDPLPAGGTVILTDTVPGGGGGEVSCAGACTQC